MTKHPPKLELLRKGVHLAGLAIPGGYWLLGEGFLFFFFPVALLFVFLDFLRFRVASFRDWCRRYAGELFRPEEWQKLSGGSHYLFGSALTLALFPAEAALAALLVLALADPMASIVGRRWGTRLPGGKSRAGSLAFFLSSWLILVLYLGGNPLLYLPAAFLGTLAEARPRPLDDNVAVPLVVGLMVTLMR
jgi:dolichol kinase